MASRAHLRLNGMKSYRRGKDPAHLGWFVVDAVRFVRPNGPMIGRGGGAGGADLQDITLVRTVDMDTPELCKACSDGSSLRELRIDMPVRMAPNKTGTRRIVISKARVLRHSIGRPLKSPTGGKGSATTAQETIMLRCSGLKISDS